MVEYRYSSHSRAAAGCGAEKALAQRVTIDHRTYAAELAARGYEHWVSLEMREPKPFALDALAGAVRKVKDWYG